MNLQRRPSAESRRTRRGSGSAAGRLGPRQDRRPRPQGPAVPRRLQRPRRSSRAARCRWSAASPSAASTTVAPEVAVVNVGDLERRFEAGEEVNADTLKAKRPGQGPVRRAEGAGRRRADQEPEDLRPPFSRIGRGEDREGRRPGRSCCRARSRWSRDEAGESRNERSMPANEPSQLQALNRSQKDRRHVGKDSRRLHDPRAAAEDPA